MGKLLLICTVSFITIWSSTSLANSLLNCIDKFDISEDSKLYTDTYTEETHKRNIRMMCDIMNTIYGIHVTHLNKYNFPSIDKFYKTAMESIFDLIGDEHASIVIPKNNDTKKEEYYSGIGALMAIDGNIPYLVHIPSKSPADIAGLLPGDILLKIGDIYTSEMNPEDIFKYVHGKDGTTIRITVKRDEQELEFDIIRRSMAYPKVHQRTLNLDDKEILYLKILGFDDVTDEFVMNLFVNKYTDAIILDLRFNPGGQLKDAINVASSFLKKKEIVNVLYSGLDPSNYSSGSHPLVDDSVPMVVLVNKESASAAEIVSKALQVNKRAIVVGEKTTGKGTVQVDVMIPSKSIIRFTVAEFTGPYGTKIDGIGVIPDVIVPLDIPITDQAKIVHYGNINKDKQFTEAMNIITFQLRSYMFPG